MSTSTDAGPLSQYFAQYPPFTYDSNAVPTSEFYRMCDLFDWERDTPDRQDAFALFRIALTQQFNAIYGSDANNLAAWQLLCLRLGVDPMPSNIKECRRIVTGTHVNLVDLVVNSGTVRVFDSVAELSTYSRFTGKIFPREDAYAGELLRYLLRHIMDPSKDSGRGGPGREPRGGRRGRGRGGSRAGGSSRGRGNGSGRGT
ncbi:hypothetical protein GALMADRAFT_258585 [Galerina marginata CBS 339.88]|uniref:Uncharacterized protein n=1 Tax=Galerina marginata (strain CBS 339.88) TaxID=685588 RepID=A0A067S8J2_GALM3|nr:hypothetical protein GALMADRAFT_258585 [Galerina marginata CBS 339.88]